MEVQTAVFLWIRFFWDVKLYPRVNVSRESGGTSGNTYPATQYQVPENHLLQNPFV
jgi:hypothetical protein